MRIALDPRTVTATRGAMRSVKKYATGGAWNMLNKLTMLFIRSAVAGTPIAKKKREIFRARSPAEMKAIGGWRFAVKFPFGLTGRAERLGGTMDGHWLGTNSMEIADDMAQITYYGAAKASWGGMFSKMGVKADSKNAFKPASSLLGRVMRTANWIKFNRTPEKQSIVTVNRLTYLDKIGGSQIQQTALTKARNSFEHSQKKTMAAGLELAWRGRAAA
jgi:hypothetical protein